MHLAPVFWIIAGYCACSVTIMACGFAVIRACRLDLNRAETICLGYILGFPVASALALALAVIGMATKVVFIAVSCVALAALWRMRRWVRERPRANLFMKPRATEAAHTIQPEWFAIFLALAWIVYGSLYLPQAMAPPTAPDALTYHLGFVNLWYKAHGLLRLENMYAAMPEGMEMLFLYAFSIGRHAAATLVHFSLLLLLPWLMLLYGVRFKAGAAASACAAMLVFAAPIVGADGAAPYVDVALAVFAFAAVWLLQMWKQTRLPGALRASCLLAGFCLATKYTGGAVVVFVAAVVLWECRSALSRPGLRTVIPALLLLLASVSPYLVRNAIWYQNPVAPLGNAIFRNRHFPVEVERSFAERAQHLGGVTWRDIPGELTLGGGEIGGHFGPVFALAPLALLGLLFPRIRFLTAAALCIAGMYAANRDPRFLIPAAPLIAMALAYVIARQPRGAVLLAGIALAHLILSWPGVDQTPGWRVAAVPLDVATRSVSEDDYLESHLDSYRIARATERLVPPNEPILALQDLPQAYMKHVSWGFFQSSAGDTAAKLIWANSASPTAHRRRLVFRFPRSPVRAIELTQHATKVDETWDINEVVLFDGAAPIRRSPGWKLDANPEPWDIGLAFDGDEVTRWSSWEHLRPGMWIRAGFDRTTFMDKVVLLVNEGNWGAEVRLRALTASGQWMDCGRPATVMDPPLDLRRAAVRAIEGMGFRYLVFSKDDYAAASHYNSPEEWGLRTVIEANGYKLVAAE